MTWKQKWYRSRRAHAKNDGRLAVRLAEAKKLYEAGWECDGEHYWPYFRGPILIAYWRRQDEIFARFPLTR